MKDPFTFGAEKEGNVIRLIECFVGEDFRMSAAKWVREDHPKKSARTLDV